MMAAKHPTSAHQVVCNLLELSVEWICNGVILMTVIGDFGAGVLVCEAVVTRACARVLRAQLGELLIWCNPRPPHTGDVSLKLRTRA
jgi:hypothetical protein